MIDNEKLNKTLNDIQVIILARTRKLMEASNVVDYIKLQIGNVDEVYLKHYIRCQLYYIETLNELDNDLVDEEKKCLDTLCSEVTK